MTRALIIGGGLLAAIAATPAAARDHDKTSKSIAPYIEIGQVLDADLNSGDVLTYTTVAAGIDASIQTRRVQVDISYRYEHEFAESKHVGDSDIHSGLARVAASVAPGLSIEGGALATRSRSDIRGAAPGIFDGNRDNISNVYSVYAGPTFATNAGPVGLNAAYRYGYTKVTSPDFITLAPGSRPLDTFDDSRSQLATASAEIRPGVVLPVGLTASGAWERDDAGQLDQRFDDQYGRVDALLPVTPTLALAAGVGYENVRISQRDPVIGTNGQPATDSHGRFVTDEASPRRIAYDFDGVYYDAGVVWKPSPRTTLEAHVGKRYGSMSYTGALTYAATESIGLQVGVYDTVSTFGQQLQDGIANLPTSFVAQRDAFSQQFSGCVFGTSSAATGGCLNDVFQSISTAGYRVRGVTAVLSANRGPLSFGAGAGYTNRHFFAPGGTGYTVNGISDQSYFGQLYASYQIDRASGISGDLFADYYDSGLGGDGVVSEGATGEYYHNFGRISTAATVGLYNFSQPGFDDQTGATGQVTARYQF